MADIIDFNEHVRNKKLKRDLAEVKRNIIREIVKTQLTGYTRMSVMHFEDSTNPENEKDDV